MIVTNLQPPFETGGFLIFKIRLERLIMKRLFVMGLLFMFMAVAPVVSLFAAEPEVATNSGPISSVTVAGLVEQNGTPTPTTPIDIVSNNGVLKVSKNLFDGQWEYGNIDSSGPIGNAFQYVRSVNFIPVSPSTQYMLSTNNEAALGYVSQFYTLEYDSSKKFIANTRTPRNDVVRSTNGALMTTAASTAYIKVFYYSAQKDYTTDTSQFNFQIEKGSIKTEYHPHGEVYVDGEVETIGDSANHTATVATLLGVGDYRDTQNINTGAITRRVGVKVFDGTESWTYSSTIVSEHKTFLFYIDDSDINNNYAPISNSYKGLIGSTSFGNMKNNTFKHGSSSQNYYFVDDRFDNVNDFKAYLAEQYAAGTPVIVIYPLKTPTTESVAGQTMTTAPVDNRTGGVTGMTITTLLSSGASVVITIAANAIKIATTAYNAARFSPVVTDLNSAVATIREIVTKTINQTAAIASLQADKQTRPEDACPAGKKCLLVETEENGVIVPHWFPIIEAPENTE